jgi:hypothetical protein
VYAMCEVIDENLSEALVEFQTAGDLTEPLRNALGNPEIPLVGGTPPDDAFDYATIYDTLGYTVSGAMLDWMAHPEELGGLGMTTLDFEMSLSHMAGGNVYNPEFLRMEVAGYREAIRTISRFAVQNSDTPTTADEFDTTIETKVETTADDDGESVAFVTPTDVTVDDEGGVVAPTDPLTRSSDGLNFAAETAVVDTFTASGAITPGGPGTTTVERTFDTGDLDGDPFKLDAELSWVPPGNDLEFYLEDPTGTRVGSAQTLSNPETLPNVPLEKSGTYTFIVETYANTVSQFDISATFFGEKGDGETTTDEETQSTTVAGTGVASVSQEVPAGLHSMQVHTHSHSAIMDLELVSPSGEVVQEFEGITETRVGGKCCGFPEWDVADPEPGEWTVRMTNRLVDAKEVDVQFATLASNSTNPDPVGALGYEQRDYEVTPLQFAVDYGAAVEDAGSVEFVSVNEVASADGLADYDHAVVIHDYLGAAGPRASDDGATNESYYAALDAFVDDGNNLVLTDTGVNLLRGLENDLVGTGQFAADAFTSATQDVAAYTSKNPDHPLLTDVRPIQEQLWKVAPLGYNVSGQAPSHLVTEGAFTSGPATASVAGRIQGGVGTGSLTREPTDGTGIHVIGSLLPPASQANLHPFGLLDYTVSFLGYLVFTSALGFQQVRTVAGDEVRFGRGDVWDTGSGSDSGGSGSDGSGSDDSGSGDADLAVSGSRADGRTVYTDGDTAGVELTVTDIDGAGAVRVTDAFPPSWTVANTEDVQRIDQQAGVVTLKPVSTEAVENSEGGVTRRYFAEAPNASGQYTFGPATATQGDESVEFGGTDDNTVASTSPSGSATGRNVDSASEESERLGF